MPSNKNYIHKTDRKELRLDGLYLTGANTQSLEERCAEMREKFIKLPAKYATKEARRQRLRNIRERTGMTVKEFAWETGMTPAGYEGVERGSKNCSITLLKLAERVYAKYYNKMNLRQWKQKKRENARLDKIKQNAILMSSQGVETLDIAKSIGVPVDTVVQWLSQVDPL